MQGATPGQHAGHPSNGHTATSTKTTALHRSRSALQLDSVRCEREWSASAPAVGGGEFLLAE
jgi:hypothetical protein